MHACGCAGVANKLTELTHDTMMVLRIVGLAALVTVARGTLALARSPPTRLRTRFCAGGGIAAA